MMPRTRLLVGSGAVALVFMAVLTGDATAASRIGGGAQLPGFDARVQTGRKTAAPAPAVTLRARAGRARALGRSGVAESDPRTGGLRLLARLDGFLSPPDARDPVRIALDYVAANAGVVGLDAGDIAALHLVKRFTSPDGVTHLLWEQTWRGIPIFDSGLRVNVAADGRIVNVGGAPVPDPAAATAQPGVSAGAALAAAARDAGAPILAPRAGARSGPQRKTRFSGGHEASLVLFPRRGGTRLAWLVDLRAAEVEAYSDVIDARSGALLHRSNLVSHATGTAWENHPGASGAGGAAAARSFSTFLDSATTLSGDNAHAYADVNGDDVAQATEEIPPTAPGGDWGYARATVDSPSGECPSVGCTWNHDVPNSWRGAGDVILRQNATQAFYFVNRFHDHLAAAPIGFDEAAGNFQKVNPSGLGVPGDPVLVETSDGADKGGSGLPDSAHLNNADMVTEADGTSPRMQMYLFSGDGRGGHDVNGGDDGSIVYHEYTHGLSMRSVIRLPGGKGALDLPQSQAMGEGWSDWYTLDFLAGQGLVADTAADGEVVLGSYADRMLRSEPVDCPVGAASADCPGTAEAGAGGYTFGDYGKVSKRGGTEIHSDGEIWAQTLWDLRRRLIADLGETAGIARAESLVTGAMRLSPPDPSFLDMRNAIVQADTVAGAPDRARIWAVFAARGMGYFASTLDALDADPVEDFSLPPSGAGTTVEGTVRDATTGDAVPSASVAFGGHASTFPSHLQADTDAAGQYSIADVPPGTYPHLIVRKPGYERTVRTQVTVPDASPTDVRIRRDWAALAGGATAIAGQEASDSPGAFAVDQLPSTGWAAPTGASQTLTIRLPATIHVSSFVVDPRAPRSLGRSSSLGDVEIQTAPDAGGSPGAFTQAAASFFTLADDRAPSVLRADAADVRYVRVVMKSPQGADSATGPGDTSWEDWMALSEIEVYGGTNQPPDAKLGAEPPSRLTGEPVVFSAAESSDADGVIEKYEWDLDGNGTYETATGRTPDATRSYDTPRELTAHLRVTDNQGETAEAGLPLVIESGAEITDLGDLGGASARAGDINATDLVVGDADTTPGAPDVHAFAFDGGAMTDLGGVAGQRDSIALAANDAGQAVGGVGPDVQTGSDERAALFAPGGGVTELGALPGGSQSLAFAINGQGTAVGQAQRTSASGPQRAFVKPAAGPMTEIGTFDGTPASSAESRAYDINASGQVVGESESSTLDPQHAHAFLWNGAGPPTDLGTLGGRNSTARAINDKGLVVGYGEVAGLSFARHSWVRLVDGTFRDLGTLGGDNTVVRDVNEKGDIVGGSEVLGNVLHAFLYRKGRVIDLNAMLPPDAKDDWTLLGATAINDAGRVAGYGLYKGHVRAYLLDLGDCSLCVEKVTLEHKQYPEGTFVEVPAGGTTDGNAVKVRATVHNKLAQSQTVTATFVDTRTKLEIPGSRVSGLTLAAGETKALSVDWDVRGLAWAANGDPIPARFVKVSLELGRRTLDSRTAALKVLPRPVFLVHGLLSTPDTWNDYVNDFVPAANSEWNVFAVPGMNTGSYGTALEVPGSIYSNAKVLHDYIESKRDELDAWHVDLVGHSMGGLISRQYIDDLMPSSPDSKPVVRHLVMLGTPNQGSACAELVPLPITYELRREVAANFNARVTKHRNVPFSLLAGNSSGSTCNDPSPGDGVVSLTSALWTLTDTLIHPGLSHTSMTASGGDFSGFVKPHLLDEDPPPAGKALEGRARAAVPPGSNPQLVASGNLVLPVGVTDVPLPVEAVTRLGFDLIAPASVGSTLIDPDGQTVSTVAAGSPEAASLFRTGDIASPAAGAWKLRLTNGGGADTQVSLGAWVKGSALDLAAEAGVQRGDGRIPLRASLRDGADAVKGATIVANVRRLGGQPVTVSLLDDGAHGDDAAGDGTYAGVTPPLAPAVPTTDGQAPGGHLVVVRADTGGRTRFTTTSTLAGAQAAPPPTGSVVVKAGELDPTFGAGGKIVTPFGARGGADAVAVQPDGKLLVAGSAAPSASGAGEVFALARYNEDGTLDASFGTDGQVALTSLQPSGGAGRGVDLALQPNGRIVVAGGNHGGRVVRYTANGAIDTSFGGGDGIADVFQRITAVAVDPSGDIVVAGYEEPFVELSGPILSRFTSAGLGVRTSYLDPPPDDVLAKSFGMTIDTSGRVVLAGMSEQRTDDPVANQSDGKLAILRLGAGDEPDASFGDSGWAVLDPYPYDSTGATGLGQEPAYDAVALPGGKIAVTGSGDVGAGDKRFLVAQVTAAGAPDPDFGGGDGIVVSSSDAELSGTYAIARGIARQADGKLVVAGEQLAGDSGVDFAVTRHLATGDPDTSFSTDGRFSPVLSKGSDEARAVAVQGDGRIVLAGAIDTGGGSSAFGLARVLGKDTKINFTRSAPTCANSSAGTEAGTTVTVGMSCSDADGDPFGYSIVSAPVHGTLSAIDQSQGTVVYHPAAGFLGADSFRFKATDGDGDSAVSTVTITVHAPPPVPPPFNPPPGGGSGGGGSGGGGSGGGSSGGGASSGSGDCRLTAAGCPVNVACPTGTEGSCNGDISGNVVGGGARASASRKPRRVVVLKARFRIPAGQTRKVRLKLTKAGRKLLRKKKRLRVILTITTRDAAGGKFVTRRKLLVRKARH